MKFFIKKYRDSSPVFVYIIWAFWVTILYSILATSLTFNVAPVSENTRNLLRTFLPQGWGFFTKSPREYMVDAYKIDSTRIKMLTYGNSSIDNLMGFSRSSRYIGFELNKILTNSKKNWITVRGALEANIPQKSDTIVLNGRFRYFTNGNYIFRRYKPIPWAWASNVNEDSRPVLIKKITLIIGKN